MVTLVAIVLKRLAITSNIALIGSGCRFFTRPITFLYRFGFKGSITLSIAPVPQIASARLNIEQGPKKAMVYRVVIASVHRYCCSVLFDSNDYCL